MATFDQLLGKLSELVGGERAPANAMAGARGVAESLEPRVTYRASMLPVGNFDDGSVGMVWPQSAVDAKNAFARFHRGESPQPEDAVLAGLVMSGGIAAPRPVGSIGMFGGRLAKTADQAKLAQAEELAAKGAPREQIWNDTGWFQGKDGKWRFEIDDKNLAVRRGEGEGVSAAGPISHPEFAAAYPEAAANIDTKVGFWPEKSGGYSWPDESGISAIEASGPTRGTRRSVAAHELQHAVQMAEGWTEGKPTNFNALLQPWKLPGYFRHPREQEARAVQRRLDLTPEQRAARPPWVDDKSIRSVAGVERAEASSGLPSHSVEAGSRFARMEAAAAKRAVDDAPDATWYHGTALPKDAPLIVPDGYYGVHMTRSKELARSYGDERGNLRAYEDGFQNPFTMPPVGSPEYAAALAKAREILPGFDGTKGSLERNAASYSKILRERGYDSIISQDETLLDDALEGIAFSPNDMYRLYSNPKEGGLAGWLTSALGRESTGDGEHHSRAQPRNPSGRFVTSDSFDGKLHKFSKLIDTDGDGVPDTVVPEAGASPTNAMSAMRGGR
jgi:hypothetical protein